MKKEAERAAQGSGLPRSRAKVISEGSDPAANDTNQANAPPSPGVMTSHHSPAGGPFPLLWRINAVMYGPQCSSEPRRMDGRIILDNWIFFWISPLEAGYLCQILCWTCRTYLLAKSFFPPSFCLSVLRLDPKGLMPVRQGHRLADFRLFYLDISFFSFCLK